jgi:hypothetical protein
MSRRKSDDLSSFLGVSALCQSPSSSLESIEDDTIQKSLRHPYQGVTQDNAGRMRLHIHTIKPNEPLSIKRKDKACYEGGPIRLFHRSELPQWYGDNPYILSGCKSLLNVDIRSTCFSILSTLRWFLILST